MSSTNAAILKNFKNAQIPSWKKALIVGSEWSNKDEFLDIIYWGRQIISVISGIICGLIPITGFIGLLIFLILNSGGVYLFSCHFHKVDDQEYGGVGEIIKEGMMTSFATFLVTWILLYTSLYKVSHL
ncbi:unnamed protein product [Gordionus sp. m RMFG-2023]|uniref:GEL complex subunit OPTI-like n=1 Tax=Gordionus sp. m RMFG-2023 TaxID=3053472 RepID=UPI0030E2C869